MRLVAVLATLFACSAALASEPGSLITAPDQVTTTASSDPALLRAARAVAEQYWNAQKQSDEKAFREVTPHTSMNVVFSWSYVNQSVIRLEKAAVAPIATDLEGIFEKKGYQGPYVDRIAERNPMLGQFFRQGFWETVTPKTLPEAKAYQLMQYDFIVDAELGSQAGTVLKKRVTTVLRRLIVDSHDSGWKVFFVSGI